MVRHPAARRIPREKRDDDDAFVEGVLESTVFVKQHARALVIGGVVLVVAVIAILYWRGVDQAREERAAAELVDIRQAVQSGNPQLAVVSARTFLDEFDGTSAAPEVRLMLAQALLETGEAQEAIDAVQPLSRDVEGEMGATAAFLLAAAYEAAGQTDAAEAAYLRVADDGRFLFQRQEALDQAARVRTQSGDTAGAIAHYERLVEMTPEQNQERAIYTMRLAELRAAHATAGGS
jgi:predicted negative regulator of RcsB-dependent stress response